MSRSPPTPIELRPLSGTAAEVATVQALFDAAPQYARTVTGEAGRPGAAARTFDMLPAGCTREHKRMFLILEDNQPVGFSDVIHGFPDATTAYIGLFMLAESRHGAGVGRRAYARLESAIESWPGIDRIELSVVAVNAAALGFWRAMGFEPTGRRTHYEAGSIRSEHVFFDKKIKSRA